MTSPAKDPGLPRIDRDSELPFYHQLKHLLTQRVRAEGLTGGARFWSEHELCQAYGLSRSVVRQALGELEAEGFIERMRGKGTFLVGAKEEQGMARSAGGLHDLAARSGRSVSSLVLRQEVVPAGDAVAEALELPLGEPVTLVERVRSVDGEPWAITTTWLPTARFPGLESLDLTHDSLYAHLREDHGVRFGEARRSLEAGAASQHAATHLGVPLGAPGLVLRSTIRDVAGLPVETFIAFHRGDRSRFEVVLNGEQDVAQMRVAQPS